MFLTIGTVYYSSKTVKNSQNSKKSPLVYQSSHVYQDCSNSVPIVKNSQKTVKQQKNDHWCTNRHMSTQCPPNTQSRANAVTLRNPHHMCLGSGPRRPWAGLTICVYMDVHASGCRVLLPFLLPTDDACSSPSLSTTVIKFSIFSDTTRKLSALPRELRRKR